MKINKPNKGVVVAFDFGLARIGVATGNIESRTATPLTTIKAVYGKPHWPTIDRLIAEWLPIMLVIGQPSIRSGKRLLTMLKQFVDTLNEQHAIPTVLYDEILTSASARNALKEQRQLGSSRQTVRGDIDKIAAAIILEDFLSTDSK